MVRKNNNKKPRINWERNDDEYGYDDDFYYSTTCAEQKYGNHGNVDEEAKSTGTKIVDSPSTFENGQEVTETSWSDKKISTLLQSFDDVALDDSTDILELSLSDNLVIESNNALSKNDETSVMLFDREIYLEEKESDSTHEDEWDVLTAIESLKNNSLYSTNEDDWDAVSSVNSVMSIETFQSNLNELSYKDIVTKNSSTKNDSHNQNLVPKDSNMPKEGGKGYKCSPRSSSAMVPIDENDCSDIYMYEEYEGYKYSRGGKDALKFRGVNRHERGRTSSFKYHTKNYRKSASRNSY